MTTDYHKLMMEIIHGETEKSRQREYQWFKKKYPMVGHRADTIICDDVSTELAILGSDPWGEPKIAEAIPKIKELNMLYGQRYGKTMTGLAHYLSSKQEEDMGAPIPTHPQNRMFCHLCFGKRTKIDVNDNMTEKTHDHVEVATFDCGTQVSRVLCESKKDGEWTVNDEVMTVIKGKNCI